MKKFLVFMVAVVTFSTIGCASWLPGKPYLPKGAVACSYDWQCGDSEICGFEGVDQYAHCVNKTGSSHFDF